MKKIFVFLSIVLGLCLAKPGSSETLDNFIGSWSGFYRDAAATKSYASTLSVIKTVANEYLGDWEIQIPSQAEFGLSVFYKIVNEVGKEEFYSCEQDSVPARCTFWKFEMLDVILGERYEAVEGQAPKYIGYFYYKKQ